MEKYQSRWLLLLLLVAAGPALGQWGPIVQLSQTDSASYAGQYGPPLVANGPYVHAIWSDCYAGARCLVCRRSTDQGANWSGVTPLTSCITYGYIFAYGSGSNIHFVFDSSGWGSWYRRSSDNGASWSNRDSLAEGFPLAFGSSRQGSVYLAYIDNGDTVAVKRSTNDGASWSDPDPVGRADMIDIYGDLIAEYPPFVYLAFRSHDSILVSRSTNSGATWEPAMAAVATSGLSSRVWFVADDGNRLHLSWTDDHTGNDEVYYTRSTNNGASWEGITRLTISNGSHLYWLCARDGMVFVCYENDATQKTRRRSFDGGATWEAESKWPTYYTVFSVAALGAGRRVHLLDLGYVYPSGGWAVTYYRSRDAGTSWPDSAVSISACDALDRYPRAIVVSGGDVHALWEDYETGNYEIYYRRGVGLGGIEQGDPAEKYEVAVRARPSIVSTATTISYTLPSAGPVAVLIYEMNGRLVKKWNYGRTLPGKHDIAWACQNADGRRVEPGVYFCIIQTPAGTSRCRLVVL